MGRIEVKPMEKVVSISTTIPISVYQKIKEQRWHFNELIIMGCQSKEGMPKFYDRVSELEAGNQKLQEKLTKLSMRLSELE